MLDIAKDESLYSFIFRTQSVYGLYDFSNIISQKGEWLSVPQIQPGSIHFYNPINEKALLEALNRSEFYFNFQGLFDNPLRPQEFLKHVLYDTNLSDRHYYYAFKARKIKYCLKCIKQNIRDIGFGVLCCKWNHAEYCSTHKTPLNFIPKYSRSNSVKA